uniref:phosphatidylinositol 4-kinase gamma 3 n=1 Tax=Erigeron canadensis TaxID=72917 RepID=UPI001CB8F94A|nr:phosphatidylinositol 4-kinase gamma 3 [Erigeron canadensis]
MSTASVGLTPFLEDYLDFPNHVLGQCDPWSRESILIFLTMLDSVVPIRVSESESIASIKLRIQTSKGFYVKNQMLVFDGKELARNNYRVRDYGVTDGDVLYLVLRLSDLQTITVRTVCGKEFELKVERKRNVGYVKQQIASREKSFVGPDDQALICNGEELEDQRLISDLCSSEDATIHFLVRKSVKVKAIPVKDSFEVTMVAREFDNSETGGIVLEKSLASRGFLLEPMIVNPKIQVKSVLKKLIDSTFDGLEKGFKPIRSTEGTGGTYFMQDSSGKKYVSVFKPIDEEPMALNNPNGLPLSTDGEGLKKGTRVGEGAIREVAAYLLDDGFAGVPPTVLVKCLHEAFNYSGDFDYSQTNVKVGSLQMFIRNCGSCEDMGPSSFPVQEVHKISVLDIRLANADRHAGNILFTKEGEDGRTVLVPIDHGYCLPESFEDCTFDWLYWSQAQEPYSEATIEYISTLDAEQDLELLKFHGWEVPVACARIFRISTMLLKKGAARGLTPFAIGSIMCRETLKKESIIEQIVREAEEGFLPGTSEDAFIESVSLIMDHWLDKLSL